jgi:hypothetical protein
VRCKGRFSGQETTLGIVDDKTPSNKAICRKVEPWRPLSQSFIEPVVLPLFQTEKPGSTLALVSVSPIGTENQTRSASVPARNEKHHIMINRYDELGNAARMMQAPTALQQVVIYGMYNVRVDAETIR